MNNLIRHSVFGVTPEGKEVTEYTLVNIHGWEMKVIDFGCTITSLKTPDRIGRMEDIVLGFEGLDGYLHSRAYIGCIVGRYANRIAHGRFSLKGKEYALATNLPPHHIHGGVKGFSHTVWKSEEISTGEAVGLRFTHLSPDGDEGYPGNLSLDVKYLLGNDNTLSFEYQAVTDQATIINLTQHSYFNLNGGTESILEHELTVYADQFLPADASLIPTGEIRNVEGTPFDFRNAKKVGRDIGLADDQLETGHGYDHTFILRPSSGVLHHAATLQDKGSGRRMDVYTSEPGMQVYTANFLNSPDPGKNDIALIPRMGICLETQHFPDSPNHPEFPSVVLEKGETYFSKTVLRFSTP